MPALSAKVTRRFRHRRPRQRNPGFLFHRSWGNVHPDDREVLMRGDAASGNTALDMASASAPTPPAAVNAASRTRGVSAGGRRFWTNRMSGRL
jgi:hypothetical protein